MIDRAEAVEKLIEAFPAIEADITDEIWSGLVHLEISCFARYTQQQIDSRNESELKRCFELALQFALYGDERLVNAMYASFLENLTLEDQNVQRSWARTLMPPVLSEGYNVVMGGAKSSGK